MILNIREAASQRLDDFSFDLHLSDTDSNAYRSRLSFARNPAVFHDGDHKNDIFQRRGVVDSVVRAARVRMVSVSNTASHVTLPMTRDAGGKKVVGRPELDDGEDDEKVSIRTSPEEWV